MEKIKVDKLAVFDLDDTLYHGNSHFSILNDYYKTTFFSSILIRCIGRLFPKGCLFLINLFYKKIPKEYKMSYTLPCRNDVLEILEKKRSEGYKIIIISNAPNDLLIAASKKINLPYRKAGIGLKHQVLQNEFCYKKLFVCTDNKTDLDLLMLANESIITCKRKDKSFFEVNMKENNYRFMCEDEEL